MYGGTSGGGGGGGGKDMMEVRISKLALRTKNAETFCLYVTQKRNIAVKIWNHYLANYVDLSENIQHIFYPLSFSNDTRNIH